MAKSVKLLIGGSFWLYILWAVMGHVSDLSDQRSAALSRAKKAEHDLFFLKTRAHSLGFGRHDWREDLFEWSPIDADFAAIRLKRLNESRAEVGLEPLKEYHE